MRKLIEKFKIRKSCVHSDVGKSELSAGGWSYRGRKQSNIIGGHTIFFPSSQQFTFLGLGPLKGLGAPFKGPQPCLLCSALCQVWRTRHRILWTNLRITDILISWLFVCWKLCVFKEMVSGAPLLLPPNHHHPLVVWDSFLKIGSVERMY